jgi:hypothetical protein
MQSPPAGAKFSSEFCRRGGLLNDRHKCTNTIEGFWSIFKRGAVGTFHKISAKCMPLYVAEFQFRYNNRFNADILERQLKRADINRLIDFADNVRSPCGRACTVCGREMQYKIGSYS